MARVQERQLDEKQQQKLILDQQQDLRTQVQRLTLNLKERDSELKLIKIEIGKHLKSKIDINKRLKERDSELKLIKIEIDKHLKSKKQLKESHKLQIETEKRLQLKDNEQRMRKNEWDDAFPENKQLGYSTFSKQMLTNINIQEAERCLTTVRTEFVKRVSEPILNSLMGSLLAKHVISDEEMESVKIVKLERLQKAREVIDMVRKKGKPASSEMIHILNQLDPNLSEHLHEYYSMYQKTEAQVEEMIQRDSEDRKHKEEKEMRERFEKELKESLREKEETIQELKVRQAEERQMREIHEGEVMAEVERRLMKIILPEIYNNFMTSKTKMQREFETQLEEKNTEITSLRERLEEMNKHCSDLEEKNRETSATGPTLPVIPPINAVYLRPCCENCKHFQSSYGNEKIIPEKLSRGRLQAQLKEGVHECVFTGLIFEALVPVLVRYSVLSWSTFSKFLQDPWMIAGPIFNVHTDDKDASVLKSIQLPHSLCLAGQDNEIAFGILHITGKHPVIERVEYSGSHLKWLVTSLSPFGSIFLKREEKLVKPHGAVLVYKDQCSIDESHTFRIYLTVNSPSHINDIYREVDNSSRSYMRIEKNTNTVPLEESKYHLMSKPGGEIEPEDLMFTQEIRTLIGYYEAYYDQPPPFKFHLKASGTDITTWSATIRPGDLVGTTEKKTSKEDIYKHDQIAFPEDGKNTESILLRRRTNTMEIPPDKMIRQNKTTLQDILMADTDGCVIQCVFEAELLVSHEYHNLRSISSPSKAAVELVDKMIFKGETTCRAFLCLLQDTKLTGMFPSLKRMPWYQSPVLSVQHPVESASVHSRSSRSKSTPRCSVFWISLFICTVFFFICLAYFFKGNIIDSLT